MAHRFSQYLVILGCGALFGLSGCGSDPQQLAPGRDAADGVQTPAATSVDEKIGSIELSLVLGAARLDSMNYAVVGSGFATSGSLDVSHSSRVSGIIGGIPIGRNYTLTMTGKGASTTPLDCSGSVSFDLNDVGPVPVTIPINCREPAVVEPAPTTAMPAPVPPFAALFLACTLAVLGILAQRRTARV